MGDGRVELRAQSIEDAQDVIRWRSLPEVAAEMFSERAPTLEEHLAWFAGLGNSRKEFIIVSASERKSIGTIGLSHVDCVQGHAEYGILIGEPAFMGRGYARAASEAVLRFGFEELGLFRIYLRVFPENLRAIKLYETLGFEREGVLRAHVLKAGHRRDVVVMGLLEPAWRKRALFP